MIDEKKLIEDLIPLLNKNGDMVLAGGIIGIIDTQPKVGDCDTCQYYERTADQYPCSHCRNCYLSKFKAKEVGNID